MKRNALIEELLTKGFVEADGSYKRKFSGRDIRLFITSTIFGTITELSMICEFENDLEEDLHEEVLEKAESLVNGVYPNLKITSIGFDFLEAKITGKAKSKSAEIVIKECAIFAEAIAPILGKYLL